MGTSRLQEGMVEHGGFKRVVNVDVSSVRSQIRSQIR